MENLPRGKRFSLVENLVFLLSFNRRWYFSFLPLCLRLLTAVTSIRVISHGWKSLWSRYQFWCAGSLKNTFKIQQRQASPVSLSLRVQINSSCTYFEEVHEALKSFNPICLFTSIQIFTYSLDSIPVFHKTHICCCPWPVYFLPWAIVQ